MMWLTMQNAWTRVGLNSQTGQIALELKAVGQTFRLDAMDEAYRIQDAEVDAGGIRFSFLAEGLCLHAFLSLLPDGPGAELRLSGEGPLQGRVSYPGAICSMPGDAALLPIAEGFCFPVDDPQVEVLPAERFSYSSDQSMAFAGQLRGQAWLLLAAEQGHDACFLSSRATDGLLRSAVAWGAEKGQWGYERALRLLAGADGGITSAMKAYRAYRASQGLVVPLREKRAHTPNIAKLLGAANIWLWHPNAMSALYDPSPVGFEVDNNEGIRRVADEMKAMGMDKMLFSLFFYEDNASIPYLRDTLGYLVSHYEVYKDVIPHPEREKITPMRLLRNHIMDAWPDDIALDEDGGFHNTWPITGIDGELHFEHAQCDIMSLKRALRRIPEDIRQNGWEARFIDTTAASSLYECWSPAHPMTRRVAAHYRGALLRLLGDLGQVAGTETATEVLAPYFDYSEGVLSPTRYRQENAGRRMTTILTGGDVPQSITRFMLNPRYRAPLWELAFHDCVVPYWYWGDSASSCPELIHRRDLFCRLYGAPELYSLSLTDWPALKDAIAASYHYTAPLAARVGDQEMRAFEYLTGDRLVQRTTFEDTRVTVNFSDSPYETPEGKTIPPQESLVEELP